jgi:hypothetical protein
MPTNNDSSISDNTSGRSILSGYLTTEQLAEALNKSPRTIARWRALGEGPPITLLGREILYKEASVVGWLESRQKAE